MGTTLGVLAYLSGNILYADYLNIMYIPYTGELVIYMSAFIGAMVGFLWYNSYPAQVFMGDTGSLALGATLGTVALMTGQWLLLPVIVLIPVAETISVVLQVLYFKYTRRKYGRGRRLFKMSPLHHHL
jgi:phospho-N-acetylmuramoyl-pentapeptide-transferase